ncbi:hypothetical protein DL762_009403 [Monosporascus cannonballus]|uniref:aspartate kinase n=1 Tax=Monosporascus cannonballus TaxID=155416 RepID=A0ABY0GTR8_9PEZI|nr:hypothetical protein DL762_009403 [Monosporascus cannonballus]RYO78828.1 hypothetical protein DL763_009503 [Monosporascus cannonballus]
MTVATHNSSANGWIIQKFGGTSVGKFPDKIAEDIVRASLASNKIVVVCSARSSGKKATGTTSRLLEVYKKLRNISAAISDECTQNALLDEAKALVLDICNEHVYAAQSFIKNSDIQMKVSKDIEDDCQELIDYVIAAKRFNLEVNARSKDRVVSFGEKLSCRFMAAMLKDRHVEAEYVDLSDAMHYDSSDRLTPAFYRDAAAILRKRVLACGDRVPVVTGFFGTVPGSLMDGDVGRGYTDLCAALIAVGLSAEELQVWKEVDGIFTADPTKVPTARLLAAITPSEAAELTFYGSEVIHHLTMDQVIKAEPPIPIRIKNVKNPRGNGTIVVPDPVQSPAQQIKRSPPSDPSLRKTPKRPTAVTIKNNIAVINVHSNKRSISHGFFAKVFSILNSHRISVDLISTSEVHVSMAIHAAGVSASHFEQATRELEECGDVSILRDMAILSLVGAEMKNMIGISGRMFSTLGEHNVNIEMISQGASEINISCVTVSAAGRPYRRVVSDTPDQNRATSRALFQVYHLDRVRYDSPTAKLAQHPVSRNASSLAPTDDLAASNTYGPLGATPPPAYTRGYVYDTPEAPNTGSDFRSSTVPYIANMPKAEVGSTKYLSNKLKAKGLQRLRCYLALIPPPPIPYWTSANPEYNRCERQMRDENGFKLHTQSESHVRQMMLVGEDPKQYINEYSNQFKKDFLQLLRTSHGEKQVHINHFYQEYIHNKEHIHMNANGSVATKWPSLTEFAKYLGREGICRVEETEKGIHIAWIDDSPEALRRRDAVRRKKMQDKGDEEREQRMIKEQIRRARKEAGGREDEDADDAEARELKRQEGEKIKLAFGAKPAAQPQNDSSGSPNPNPSESPEREAADKTATATTPAPEAPAAEKPAAGPVSLKMVAKPQTKNVFAAAKKNALAGVPKKKPAFEQPKKMSEAERIMKEEMERKRARGNSGFGDSSNKRQRT